MILLSGKSSSQETIDRGEFKFLSYSYSCYVCDNLNCIYDYFLSK